jgi:hypothetical protein
MMGDEREFKSAALTEVNRHIGEVAEESVARGEDWEFFCECGKGDCYEHVLLSLDAYLAARADGGAVLAPGHSLSHAELARRQAQQLRNDSQALRAEATQAARRATKQRPSGA